MILTWGLAGLTAVGSLQVLAGWIATVRFGLRDTDHAEGTEPISILKPLHGEEPLLAEALATLCEQDYPPGFQIVFGVQDPADPAIEVVRTIRDRYPDAGIDLVIDATRHGTNPKIGNLLNMLPSSRHAILVIADSDVHARPDYLRRLADALAKPGVGLVTTLYTGLPAFGTAACLLGTTQITHGFLPGALLGRLFGRRDCLGATMCLRRETLARIGGLAALKNHLADDNILGQRVCAEGLDVALADTVVATTVPERTFPALWSHELRWARTIRTLEPAAFFASVLQYPLFLAVLTVIVSGGAVWTWILFLLVWSIRALAATGIDRALRPMLAGLAFRGPLWLLPLRDLLSVAEWIASHAGRRVAWRGQMLEADTPSRLSPKGFLPAGPTKGSHAR
jgi:ceramide glucosyltransferase